MRLIHQLYIENVLSQFLQISDQLTYIESLYDSSTHDEKMAFLGQRSGVGHTLLMAAIANQHSFANKLLEEMKGFSEAEKVNELLKVNCHGATLLTVAVLCESVDMVERIIFLIEGLSSSEGVKVLNALFSKFSYKNDLCFFSSETGRLVSTADKKLEKNKKCFGELADLAGQINNLNIIENLYQASLRMNQRAGKIAEVHSKVLLEKLQEEAFQKRNSILEEEAASFREISAANHRFFATPIQGLVVRGPVISRTVEGVYVDGYLPTEEQIRRIQLEESDRLVRSRTV